MKTKQKINSVIAKALATKIHQELRNLKISDKQKQKFIEEVESDPKFQEFKELKGESNRLLKLANELEHKLEAKHNCSISFYENYKVPSVSPNIKFEIPYIDDIKNDLLLMSWSQDEDLTSDQLIAKLVKKYSK